MRLSLSCLLVALLVAPTAHAETKSASAGRMILVLDASGSMWGQIEERAKIDIARDVVKELVTDLDTTTELGLTVYGHREKGSCEDIESLIPVGPLNRDNFISTVAALTPKGKTPLTAAVKRAAEELKYTEDNATVILVSDGIETCNQDPCAVATALEAAGVNFTAHVVGFDIQKQEDIRQLKCIADNTGGKFIEAKDADSLGAALKEAVQEAKKQATGVQLKVVTEAGGAPLAEGAYWKIFSNPEGDTPPKQLHAKSGGAVQFQLEPGRYTAKVAHKKAEVTKEFEILEGQQASHELIIAQQGVVKLRAVTEAGGAAEEDVYWRVFTPAKDELSKPKEVERSGGATPSYTLLPGKYLVKATKKKAEATKEIEVLAGQVLEEEVILPLQGILVLSAVTEAGGEPEDGVFWQVFEPAKDELSKPKEVQRGGQITPSYTLLPGEYLVKVVKAKAEVTKKVEVLPGKKVTEEVLIPQQGMLELVAYEEEGGEPASGIFWRVFQPAKDELSSPKEIHRGSAKEALLLPGKYIVQATKKKAEVSKEVTVLPGKRVSADIMLPKQGVLKISATDESGNGALAGVYYRVYELAKDDLSEPKQIEARGGGVAEFTLLPGTYTVKATKGEASATKQVKIAPGKLSTEEVTLQ